MITSSGSSSGINTNDCHHHHHRRRRHFIGVGSSGDNNNNNATDLINVPILKNIIQNEIDRNVNKNIYALNDKLKKLENAELYCSVEIYGVHDAHLKDKKIRNHYVKRICALLELDHKLIVDSEHKKNHIKLKLTDAATAREWQTKSCRVRLKNYDLDINYDGPIKIFVAASCEQKQLLKKARDALLLYYKYVSLCKTGVMVRENDTSKIYIVKTDDDIYNLLQMAGVTMSSFYNVLDDDDDNNNNNENDNYTNLRAAAVYKAINNDADAVADSGHHYHHHYRDNYDYRRCFEGKIAKGGDDRGNTLNDTGTDSNVVETDTVAANSNAGDDIEMKILHARHNGDNINGGGGDIGSGGGNDYANDDDYIDDNNIKGDNSMNVDNNVGDKHQYDVDDFDLDTIDFI
nr:FP25K [Calliteara abietis nucleopolyhedrovirus]